MSVKCKHCTKENDSFCIVKGCKIKINKKRTCVDYEYTQEKDCKLKFRPAARYVPIWQQNKKEFKKKLKEVEKEQQRAEAEKASKDVTKYIEDAMAPDSLARFRSSAG